MGKSALAEGKNPMASTALADPEGEVEVGGSFTGVINPADDIDAITLDVVEGETYVVVLRGSGEEPVADTLLTVYDPAGEEVGVDDDGGAGTFSTFTFTATSTGSYTLEIQAFTAPDQPAVGGEYTVQVERQTEDLVGNRFGKAEEIELGTTIGFLETSGDKDLYEIRLEAGKTYTFELAGGADYNSDFSDLPAGELDTILTLFGSNHAQLARNDDISFPGDLSSGFTFTAETTGTYYLRAQAYTGQTGGFTLTVEELDLSQFDPLDSIDWGGQEVQNPDPILVYFAQEGERFNGSTSLGWSDYEIGQAMLAFQQYENVANVSFQITTNKRQADFKLVTVESDSFLGRMGPPGEPNAGVGEFAINGFGWEDAPGGGLEQGGYGFITLVHEFGHGMGMAHPHDTGGGSEVMIGVDGPFGDYGLFDLNQGVYTVMSYNDGWQLHPDAVDGFPPGEPTEYGYQGTLMAFDVAMIQEKYGANTSYHAGNDTYVLPDENESGAFWTSIWDAGGVDKIVHNGSESAVIDLRPATIDYSATGGGLISWVDGVFGGYTIAQNVVIENAYGGSGADVIIGNDAKNKLYGGGGADSLAGGKGADLLYGQGGADTFFFADGDSGVGKANRDVIYGFGAADDVIDVSSIDAIAGTEADDAFELVSGAFTAAGQIRLVSQGTNTLIQGSTDGDATAEFEVLIKGDFDSVEFVL